MSSESTSIGNDSHGVGTREHTKMTAERRKRLLEGNFENVAIRERTSLSIISITCSACGPFNICANFFMLVVAVILFAVLGDFGIAVIFLVQGIVGMITGGFYTLVCVIGACGSMNAKYALLKTHLKMMIVYIVVSIISFIIALISDIISLSIISPIYMAFTLPFMIFWGLVGLFLNAAHIIGVSNVLKKMELEVERWEKIKLTKNESTGLLRQKTSLTLGTLIIGTTGLTLDEEKKLSEVCEYIKEEKSMFNIVITDDRNLWNVLVTGSKNLSYTESQDYQFAIANDIPVQPSEYITSCYKEGVILQCWENVIPQQGINNTVNTSIYPVFETKQEEFNDIDDVKVEEEQKDRVECNNSNIYVETTGDSNGSIDVVSNVDMLHSNIAIMVEGEVTKDIKVMLQVDGDLEGANLVKSNNTSGLNIVKGENVYQDDDDEEFGETEDELGDSRVNMGLNVINVNQKDPFQVEEEFGEKEEEEFGEKEEEEFGEKEEEEFGEKEEEEFGEKEEEEFGGEKKLSLEEREKQGKEELEARLKLLEEERMDQIEKSIKRKRRIAEQKLQKEVEQQQQRMKIEEEKRKKEMERKLREKEIKVEQRILGLQKTQDAKIKEIQQELDMQKKNLEQLQRKEKETEKEEDFVEASVLKGGTHTQKHSIKGSRRIQLINDVREMRRKIIGLEKEKHKLARDSKFQREKLRKQSAEIRRIANTPNK